VTSPLVSVIVLNYNYSEFLEQAILSAINQSYSNLEIIVIDNASTDNSVEILDKYQKHIFAIRLSKNEGQSAARNLGIMAANGQFVAFLDADDFWESTKIQKQVKALDSKHQLSYTGIQLVRKFKTIQSFALPQFSGKTDAFHVLNPGVSIVLSGESTALVNMELIKEIGGFDEYLSSGSGWDFFRRCSRRTDFAPINEPLTYRRIHSRNESHKLKLNIAEINKCYEKLFSDPEWKEFWHLRNSTFRRLRLNSFKAIIKHHLNKLICST
jgi:alpha-1,3-rhamnosyltransferase